MAKAAKMLLRKIKKARMTNRLMYKELEKLIPNRDLTLELIEMAYRSDPRRARKIHRAIINNDRLIVELSQEFAECE